MDWWHYALEGITAVLASLLGITTAILQMLNRGLEVFIDKIAPHPNVAAATTYLAIAMLITLVVAATQSQRQINKIKHQSWPKTSARHAWILALIVFLANGVLHAVEQTRLLTGTPLETSQIISHLPILAHLPGNPLVWIVNGFLGFAAIVSYTRDAINHGNFGRPKPASKYLGRIVAAWAFEDFISMNWEHFGTNERVGELLRWLHTWSGQYIFIAFSVLIVLLYMALRNTSVQAALEERLAAQM